jgi:transcriptional regulator of acetoin/glycerol metabolism
VTLADGEIRSEHLPDELTRPHVAAPDDRSRLVELIRQHDGNISAVARVLATSRSQVHRLMQRHGIERDDSSDD